MLRNFWLFRIFSFFVQVVHAASAKCTVPNMNTVFISVLSSYKQAGVPRSPHDASGWG